MTPPRTELTEDEMVTLRKLFHEDRWPMWRIRNYFNCSTETIEHYLSYGRKTFGEEPINPGLASYSEYLRYSGKKGPKKSEKEDEPEEAE